MRQAGGRGTRDVGGAGSNPITPTIDFNRHFLLRNALGHRLGHKFFANLPKAFPRPMVQALKKTGKSLLSGPSGPMQTRRDGFEGLAVKAVNVFEGQGSYG
jgi:hypothetical protein